MSRKKNSPAKSKTSGNDIIVVARFEKKEPVSHQKEILNQKETSSSFEVLVHGKHVVPKLNFRQFDSRHLTEEDFKELESAQVDWIRRK